MPQTTKSWISSSLKSFGYAPHRHYLNTADELEAIDNHLTHIQCPLCNSSLIQSVGRIQYTSPLRYSSTPISLSRVPELWTCQTCQSKFTQNVVPETESIRLYTQGSSAQRWSSSDFSKTKTKAVVKALKTLFQPDRRVLDIGCNTGDLLDFAKQQGCQTYGVEYSAASLQILNQKGHASFTNLSDVEGCFDVITAFDLVEHHYNVPSFIDACLARLAPDGYLVFLTGDVGCLPAKFTQEKWWYVCSPEHIVFPAKQYFERHPLVKVVDWISTFAKRPKVMDCLPRLLIREIMMLRPDGRTWLLPDHALIILQKNDAPA